MKSLLAVNYRSGGLMQEGELRQLVDAQIENSLAVGWRPCDIVIVSNIDLDVSATLIRAPLNRACLTGSKMFAMRHVFDLGLIDSQEVWWAHDLDAWQNFWFDPPAFRDIGLTEYSTPEFNGGSVLLRASARDMIEKIVDAIVDNGAQREEPSINSILRSPQYRQRVTPLNSTFNVGCSAYAVRHQRSIKPILVSHFSPTSKTSWRTHVLGARRYRESSVSTRLLELLVRRFHNGIAPVYHYEGS